MESFFDLIVWLCLMISFSTASSPISHNLGSDSWAVHNANKSIKISATVPGGIYSDLRKAGILTQDIFYRFNDIEYRWVARDNWTYSLYFDVDQTLLEKKYVVLSFEGLDTVAQVTLNSHLLMNSRNMFVSYQIEVKQYLQVEGNLLEVEFMSPIDAALQASTETPYLVPPTCVPNEYHGECHINYLRKMQASFAWDWGPAFPSVGIWKAVELRGYNFAFAQHVGVETRPETSDWKISVTLYLDVRAYAAGTLSATLSLPSGDVVSQREVTVSVDQNSPSLVFSVTKEKVKLWWPNGYGNQPLYHLNVAFTSGREKTEKSVKIGFRTVKLVQVDAVPSEPNKGMTFYFRVNGVSVFAKGSNYIPAHILPELGADPARLRHLLTSAQDAHMNMLRVWGGGIYESDLFYELCDELGLLIWQDMMFACSMYPATDSFLTSVSEEVTHQVQRLQHHPCIAVWAGNNENEAALAGNWYGTQNNFSLFKEDYIKLYVDTIRPIVQRLDKTRSYLTSSPSNGLESEKEGYVAKNPYNNKYGDVHWYEYLLNLWTTSIFPKTRFSSEYGIMSLPSLDSFVNITLSEDLSMTSEFFTKRQHHFAGYIQMITEINHNVYLPPKADLETFIYLSQINQAMSMKTETEAYRRERENIDSVGEGLTMGALYWQLNDVWQAPSWSSIEFDGKWKMLHYFAVDFFSPVLASPSVDVTNQLRVDVISDHRKHSSLDLSLKLSVYNWQSFDPVFSQQYQFTMLGAGVVEVGSWNMAKLLQGIDGCKTGGTAKQNCFFYFSILSDNTTLLGPDNFYFPNPLHSVNAANAHLQIVELKLMKQNREVLITLSTDKIAAFVWLDVVGISGRFSHNGFLMVKNTTQLTFVSPQPIDFNTFKANLKLKSLQFKSS